MWARRPLAHGSRSCLGKKGHRIMEGKTPKLPVEQHHRSVQILDGIDAFFYLLVGIAFLGAAALTLIYSVINLVAGVAASIPQTSTATFTLPIAQNVLGFISDLLL